MGAFRCVNSHVCGPPGTHFFVVLAKRHGLVDLCRRSMFGRYYCAFCEWGFHCMPSRTPSVILPVPVCPVCEAVFRVVVAPDRVVKKKSCDHWVYNYRKKFKPFMEQEGNGASMPPT